VGSCGWHVPALLLAGDAGRVGQMGDRLPALRAVVKAGSLVAHPRSIGRGVVTGTGDQRAVSDAVGLLFGSSVNKGAGKGRTSEGHQYR
jgi:hypothetical protein